MKFGSQLNDAIYPEWTEYYIDYDGLKKRLRKAEKDKPFTERDETEFVELLDSNLEKVKKTHTQTQIHMLITHPSGICFSSRENRRHQETYRAGR